MKRMRSSDSHSHWPMSDCSRSRFNGKSVRADRRFAWRHGKEILLPGRIPQEGDGVSVRRPGRRRRVFDLSDAIDGDAAARRFRGNGGCQEYRRRKRMRSARGVASRSLLLSTPCAQAGTLPLNVKKVLAKRTVCARAPDACDEVVETAQRSSQSCTHRNPRGHSHHARVTRPSCSRTRVRRSRLRSSTFGDVFGARAAVHLLPLLRPAPTFRTRDRRLTADGRE